MKKFIIIFKLILLLFIQNKLSQGENLLTTSDQDSIRYEQKQRLEFELNQRTYLQNQNIINNEIKLVKKESDTTCFVIKTIQFQGARVITQKTQTEIISGYQHRCLTMDEIHNITDEVTNYYIKKGYITSLAYLPEQDLTRQHLNIQVIEGRIETIEIEKSPKRLVSMMFPNLIGEKLNLRDLEQGLEQLNQAVTVKYTMEIQPGTKLSYSRILISQNTKKRPLSLRFNIDNSGSNRTGKILITGTLLADSIFGLGEQWSVSTNTDTDISSSHQSRYYMASLNMPYGYWFYRYQFIRNQSLLPFTTISEKYPYQSQNTNQQIDINRLIYRDGYQRLVLQGSLKHKKAQTQLAEQVLTINSPTLTSISFSPQYSTVIGSGYLTFNSTIEWGIPAFGSVPDYIAEGSPRSNYRKINLSSSYNHYVSNNLTYLTSFYSQYTPDNLYATERFNVGGKYSVRGYHEQSLSGNSGFYWRNEVNARLNNNFGELYLIHSLDYGYIFSDQYGTESGTLIGGAVGLSYQWDSLLSSSLLISKPLYYPAELNPDKWSLYWSISFVL